MDTWIGVYNSTGNQCFVAKTFNPDTGIWSVRFNNPEDGADPNGYWVRYYCDDGLETQYPYLYKMTEWNDPVNRISPGYYEDTIPYWHVVSMPRYHNEDGDLYEVSNGRIVIGVTETAYCTFEIASSVPVWTVIVHRSGGWYGTLENPTLYYVGIEMFYWGSCPSWVADANAGLLSPALTPYLIEVGASWPYMIWPYTSGGSLTIAGPSVSLTITDENGDATLTETAMRGFSLTGMAFTASITVTVPESQSYEITQGELWWSGTLYPLAVRINTQLNKWVQSWADYEIEE